MRRPDARLGVVVVAAGLVLATVVLVGASGSSATSATPDHVAAPGALRLAGVVEQVTPALVVRADWQWSPAFGEDDERLTVTMAEGARPQPEGTTPPVGAAVAIAGERRAEVFVAQQLIVGDPDWQ